MPPIQVKLTSIWPYLIRVWWYDENTSAWYWHEPGNIQSTLVDLIEGNVYDVMVNTDVWLTYADASIEIMIPLWRFDNPLLIARNGFNLVLWAQVQPDPPKYESFAIASYS